MKIYYTKENLSSDVNVSLKPPMIIRDPGENDHDYSRHYRRWQSAPCIVKTKGGRLLCTFSGDNSTDAWECPNNYNQISYSDDDGKTWHYEAFVLDHADSVRMHEPLLWIDPRGFLWHFWSQSYNWWDGRGGVWAMMTENPDAENIQWSQPVRLCDGVMATPPIVTKNGEWLYPVSVWKYFKDQIHYLPDLEKSNVFVSVDQGKTLSYRGAANEPETTFDENTLAERKDGSLLMTMRAKTKIAFSISEDNGRTWTIPEKLMDHTSSRSFLAKLPSGNLILVTNDDPKKRKSMTAFLFEGDSLNWSHKILLDEREETSYPAGCICTDGTIYVAYDFNRTTDREIYFAKFTENDIKNGKGGTLRVLVSKAGE